MAESSTPPEPDTATVLPAAGGQGLRAIYLPMAGIAGIVLLADQLSKLWADGLERCSTMLERPTVGFCLAYNEGMAFSMGWGSGAIIAAVAIAIVVVLVVAARKVPLYPRLLMGAVAGGALGNVVDRALRSPAPGSANSGFMSGAVVDFLYSSFWATFNIADSAIVVGGILLSIALWRLPDPAPTEPVVESGPGTAAGTAVESAGSGNSDGSAKLGS